MPRNLKPRVSVVRVIVDSSNAGYDYYLFADRAKYLYDNGEISKIQCYASEESYFDPRRKFFREALKEV